MCLIKWQTQYNLTKNTTPVSARALLLVLENIENNTELDYMAQNTAKEKGAKGKHKAESSYYHIPKKVCQGPVNWKLPEKY